VVNAVDVRVATLPGLDATRRPAEVLVEDLSVPAARVLHGLDTATVRTVTGGVVAAEAAGLAGWALDTAVGYARTREQFGRPIGAFQAVKHKCADMLVRAEQARATAWDAARALDEPPSAQAELAVAVAAAVAVDAAVDNTKDALQVLGGVGYTWEHDAHIFLKRRLSLRALIGDPAQWRARAADLALSGARRQLALDLGADTGPVRRQVRDFLAGLGQLDETAARSAIADQGYLVPHWPAPWGRDASAVEQLVIDEEFAAAGVKRP
jgi:alkylation response protein AidB-like acyl-CoA dehydrogenase